MFSCGIGTILGAVGGAAVFTVLTARAIYALGVRKGRDSVIGEDS